MSWSICLNADEFLLKRRDALLAEESKNCLGWAAIQRAKRHPTPPESHRFLVFEEPSGTVAHAFINDADQHIILSEMTSLMAQNLVTFLDRQSQSLATIEGPWQVAQEFSKRWTEAGHGSPQSQMDQGLYELTKVTMPNPQGGRLVQAQDTHRHTLKALATGFLASFPDDPIAPQEIDDKVQRFIDAQRAYLWQREDQTFVSMAAIVRESPNASSISWVYTPPQHRRQGHAARVVATLSQAQLDAGKRFCNLHTDLANPTSNNVYRSIGYTMIARSFRIKMLPK